MNRPTPFAHALAVVVMWLLLDEAVRACPICFQVDNAHVSSGVRAAVIVLAAVTVTVVGACAAFFGRVMRGQGSGPSHPAPRPPERRNAGTPEPGSLA